MKGIVLAGGTGTRLYPVTVAVNKHLLPVYDKPLIYYSLSTLIMARIRQVLIISTPRDLPKFEELLGDGSHIGMEFSYAEQKKAEGIAQAFHVAEEFIGTDSVCLTLGDNILYANELQELLTKSAKLSSGAKIFGYLVRDPENYGVIEFDAQGNVIDIIEKPKEPRSHYAVPGLYFYDNKVIDYAKKLKPSARGELEITDINKEYLRRGQLKVEKLGRGAAWLDAGSHDTLLQASSFVQTVEQRQGLKIACIEEIAWRTGFIDKKQLRLLAETRIHDNLSDYLLSIIATE